MAAVIKSRWARLAVLIGGLVVLLLVVAGGLGTWLYARSVANHVHKVDAFQGIPEAQRPTSVAGPALNFLVVGRDNPEPGDTSSRTDTIILVHVPRSHDRAQLISIPRDTWVTVPPSAGGSGRGTNAKINAAYAWGGTPLMVRTVEDFTGVRIDHVVLMDFAGFGKVIDALGGVDVTVDGPYTSIVPPGRTYRPGVNHMDSAVALDYARQRKQFADGDFSRMRHQQAIVLAVLDKASGSGLLASPARLNDFLRATADAIQVDKNMSIFDMALNLRQLRSGDLTTLTSPSSGTGMVGDQSVVFPDRAAAARLYRAVKTDTMNDWLAANPH